jgi:shikimate dehydrogenase
LPLSSHTRAFAVLGSPVRHSLSPAMHNPALAKLGLDAVYLAFEVKPEQLAAVLPVLAALGFGGVNCTIPLKEEAFRLVDRRDPSASLVGAVNTIQFTPEGRVGHNTDGYGVREALREAFGTQVPGGQFAVVGCGGAGRGVALYLANEGAKAVTLWNRTPERAVALASEIRALGRDTEVRILNDFDSDREAFQTCDVVVQCTSAGMKPGEESPVPAAAFRKGQVLLDTIYVARETPTMRAAATCHVRTANGVGMLLHQGARALEIWTGRPAPVEVMRAALQDRLKERKPA